MKLKEFNIKLDIVRNRIIDGIEVVQGDYGTNVFNIFIVEDLVQYDLTGLTVEIAFAKPDGTSVVQDTTTGITIENPTEGKIKCILRTNTIAVEGKVLAEVRILESGKVLTTSTFMFSVRRSIITNDTIKSTNEFPLLQRLTDGVEGIIATESARVTSEQTRKTDESNRVQAENARVLAEQQRATTFAGYENRVSTVETDLTQHKLDYMPHRFQDLKTGKKYKYGFQISAEGNPQTIYEEVL